MAVLAARLAGRAARLVRELALLRVQLPGPQVLGRCGGGAEGKRRGDVHEDRGRWWREEKEGARASCGMRLVSACRWLRLARRAQRRTGRCSAWLLRGYVDISFKLHRKT